VYDSTVQLHTKGERSGFADRPIKPYTFDADRETEGKGTQAG